MVRSDHEVRWDRRSLLLPLIVTGRHQSVGTGCRNSGHRDLSLSCWTCNWHKDILTWAHRDWRPHDGRRRSLTRWRRECWGCRSRTAKWNYSNQKIINLKQVMPPQTSSYSSTEPNIQNGSFVQWLYYISEHVTRSNYLSCLGKNTLFWDKMPSSLAETNFLGKTYVLENEAAGCLKMFTNLHHTISSESPKGPLHSKLNYEV